MAVVGHLDAVAATHLLDVVGLALHVAGVGGVLLVQPVAELGSLEALRRAALRRDPRLRDPDRGLRESRGVSEISTEESQYPESRPRVGAIGGRRQCHFFPKIQD